MVDRRLVALCAGNFVVATSLHIVAGLMTEISESLQVSIAEVGYLIAVFGVVTCICAPLFAAIGSRIDRRTLLISSMVICALANIVAAFSETYGQLLVSRIIAAMTSAIFTPQAAAVTSVLYAVESRGRAITIVMAGWGLASVLGIPLGVLLGHALGWRVAMGGISVIGLAVAVALWFSLPSKVFISPLTLKDWLAVGSSKPLLLVLGASLFLSMGNSVAFSYLAAMVSAIHGAGGDLISTLFLLHGIGSLTSSVLVTMLMVRLGGYRIAMLLGGCVVMALLLWPVAAYSLVALVVLQYVWSIGFAGFPAVQQARLVLIAPAVASASIAINSSLNYLSVALGTALGGVMWGVVGPRYLSWVGVLPVLVAIIFIYLSRRASSPR